MVQHATHASRSLGKEPREGQHCGECGWREGVPFKTQSQYASPAPAGRDLTSWSKASVQFLYCHNSEGERGIL